ncbi:MAG: bifunctional folylpolyglutamate synthase/dihydrofolate synthase [Bacteroidales bacterium]|nr:bifunctional folylpolyglutamate synthase/dihydrofolate synthase [Bacteroidales bacterium]MCD8393710.1 bifunctional folylpolyglutamate synthase/dihydrofolate synthase [Bacteroidales bacterium]
MTYEENITWLYSQLPAFQRIGAAAYKPGLSRVLVLEEAFGNPHLRWPSVHIGGTNGKGSTSSAIASVLTASGLKVGLYTSPHLVEFRERIRVNGEMIPREAVVDFLERYRAMKLDIEPSFFELTMVMAFDYFAKQQVDIAVVEVGMGGRLDSTNVLTPLLSIITNISLDHTAFLGDTPAKIAAEKAGIIKPGVPVVIGEAEGEVKQVFEDKALEVCAPIVFAPDMEMEQREDGWHIPDTPFGPVVYSLSGDCQRKNAATVLTALEILLSRQQREEGSGGALAPTSPKCRPALGSTSILLRATPQSIREGLANISKYSGLMGRWMTLSHSPEVICDTGHNIGGWQYLGPRLREIASKPGTNLHMVIGFVSDKDVSHILPLMPRNASYYFTRASVERAMAPEQLAEIAKSAGLKGDVYQTVSEAYSAALASASTTDTIFIGGSTFVVADLLQAKATNSI